MCSEAMRTQNRTQNLEDTNEIQNPHRQWYKTMDSITYYLREKVRLKVQISDDSGALSAEDC